MLRSPSICACVVGIIERLRRWGYGYGIVDLRAFLGGFGVSGALGEVGLVLVYEADFDAGRLGGWGVLGSVLCSWWRGWWVEGW